MSRKFIIAIIIVLLVSASLVSVAYGAGNIYRLQAVKLANGNPEDALSGVGLSTIRVSTLQERLDRINSLLDDVDLPEDPDVDPVDPIEDPYCDGTATSPHPVGAKLAELFSVPYEEIMEWHCQGWGFGDIAIAYSISMDSGVEVATLFEMRMDGMGWGEVMQEIGYEPGDYPKKWKFAPPPKKWCEESMSDPKLIKLAEKLNLTVEEVMEQLCEEEVSIGTLQKAVKFANQMEIELEEVISERQGGKSWGQIFKDYGKIPVKDKMGNKPEKPDKDGMPPQSLGNNGNQYGLEKKGYLKP